MFTSSLSQVANSKKNTQIIPPNKQFTDSSIQRRHLCQLTKQPFGISQADWSNMCLCPYIANMANN